MTEPFALNHTISGNREAPAILYLHGFMGDLHDWHDIASRLGDRYCHIQVDLPGHGATNSDLAEHIYSMPETAALLVKLLDSHQIRQCRLIGYSMGARLSLFLLVNYPDRFLASVIESGSPGLKTEIERMERRMRDAELADRLQHEPLEQFVDRWFELPLFQTLDRKDPRFAEMQARRYAGRPNLLACSLELMGTGAQASLWEALADIRLPLLFVAGEKDPKFTRLAEQMADLCPAGQTGIIRSAGHNTHFERPAEFSAQVARFFDQI